MHRAVCPGTFDPPTNGHLDVIGRAAAMFDELIVATGVNQSKKRLFDDDERVAMLREVVAGFGNVTVGTFDGLLVDYCRAEGIKVIVKGVRTAGDYDYELQMALMNRRLTGVETVFVPAAPELAHLSSSLVKEVARFGGDVSGFLPADVHRRLMAKLSA
ncbi:MAG TPA: pantetheine-phosphate adenylyltransferase [Kribbellaceae bacterium]|nr:pantetheine-phosphate adenylyltransferase [Kribbellaceae bacterium]